MPEALLRSFRRFLHELRMHKFGRFWEYPICLEFWAKNKNRCGSVSALRRGKNWVSVKKDEIVSSAAGSNESSTATFSIRGIRVEEGLARFAGDAERYRYWLAEFLNYGPEASIEIRRAVEMGMLDGALSSAHALKGRSGMLGMAEVHLVLQLLEAALRDGEPTWLWLVELEQSIGEVCTAIDEAMRAVAGDGAGIVVAGE